MTTLVEREQPAEPAAAEQPPPPPAPRRISRLWLVAGVVVVWIAAAVAFQGKATLVIGGADQVGCRTGWPPGPTTSCCPAAT